MAGAINWRSARKLPGQLRSEFHQDDKCFAAIRLTIVESSPRPYHVRCDVICDGHKPWTVEKHYQSLPSAMVRYGRLKEEATQKLHDNSG